MNRPLVTLQRVLQNPDAVTSGKGNDLGHCGVDGKQKGSRRGPGLETGSLDASSGICLWVGRFKPSLLSCNVRGVQ